MAKKKKQQIILLSNKRARKNKAKKSSKRYRKANVMPIGPMFLGAGFLTYTCFIPFMDEKLPKKEKNFTVSHGEALAAILLTMIGGVYESLSTVHSVLKNLPIKQLLGLEAYRNISAADFSRDVLSAALDALAAALSDASSSTLFTDFANYAYSKFQDPSDVLSVHMDTTSIVLYHKLDDKDDEKIMELTFGNKKKEQKQKEAIFKILRGYSKDKRFDLGQVVISGFTSDTGVPLHFDVHNGNASDKLTFASLAHQVLPKIKELCTGLKYLVCDSAGATKECFENTCLAKEPDGTHIVSRLSDNFSLARNLIFNTSPSSMELADPENPETSIRTKTVRDVLWNNVRVKAILVFNPSLKSTKKRTFNDRAEKEMQDLQKAVKKTFACPADAVKHLNELRQKSKLCDVTLVPAKQQKDSPFSVASRKNSKNTPEVDPLLNEYEFDEKLLEKKSYRVNTTISICQDAVDWHVEKGCMYVLTTTDTESDRTAIEFVEIYKNNIKVETFWKKFKDCRLNLDSVFLRKRSRIKALLCLASFNVFASTCIENKVRMMVDKKILKIPKFYVTEPSKSNLVNERPEWSTISRIFNHDNVHVQVHDRGRKAFVVMTPITKTILEGLGSAWQSLTNPEIYRFLS